ncbi:homing endonuclease associated repeat-containing protein [Haloparvum alkalitolerans]|uniref:homing endonuclease associated repeat-containing protein n=1 Tax=Haloparvum alkalitolerans TaxID=1042953 RepID=UPI003CF3BCE0
MSEEIIEEIDAHLNEILPEDPEEIRRTVDEERREEMVRILQHAADELGKSPTVAEFDALDLATSSDAIRYVFGTWNDAKEAAGLETFQRGTSTPIDQDYFEAIDTAEKAYWLGTLFAYSTVSEIGRSKSLGLQVARVASKEHFVRGFADTVESGYAINTYSNSDRPREQEKVHLQISNPTFIEHLLAAGYPADSSDPGDFPSLSDAYRPAFVRGYLESAGYFRSQGWRITVENPERATWLKNSFEEFGAKRPTVSEGGNGKRKVNVSNVFDIKSVFEACWPDQLETTPSWEPYPTKVLAHLEAEYPYPENVAYLSGG